MVTTTHINVRDARDRLIDLLGIGQTYPLRDLAVRDEQLTVAFNTIAKIPIENSQKDVLYQLHYEHELVERTPEGDKWTETKGAGVAIEMQGNGNTILLETYRIQDDITFEILAKKQRTGQAAYLHQTATVKVGLDASLKAWIREVPYLDQTITSPDLPAPRIIHYGMSVELEIENSQEGVDYRLVYFAETTSDQSPEEVTLSVADVRGDLHNIILRSQPVYEDIDIRIRATKIFDPSENRATQTTLLDVVLPLKVRANPALPVSVDTSPTIDFNNQAIIKIADTQRTATYQLYMSHIFDRNFVHQTVPDTEVIKVGVAGEPDVQVRQPVREVVWIEPEGYTKWGESQPGTGGELLFTLDALTDDSLIIVQAEKTHQFTQDAQVDQMASSGVQLEQAAVVLVRPDPAPALRVKVFIEGAETSGEMQVFDGQPGVFYYFRYAAGENTEPNETDIGLPAYFHKRDDQDETMNKGLGQLTIGVDYVITRPLPTAAAAANLAQIPPEPPLLETGPLPTDTPLHVLAVKAQTRLSTPLTQTVGLAAPPEIRLQDSVIDFGASTKILVVASREGDRYQPFLDGNPLKQARLGNGADLSFNTDPMTADTEFELLITRPADKGISVERLVRLRAAVRPNAKLSVSVVEAVIDYNVAANIRVEASQPEVSYQLMVAGKPVGDPVTGTGDAILLPSGSLTKDTTFAIRAARIADPNILTDLEQQVTVQVRPEAE